MNFPGWWGRDIPLGSWRRPESVHPRTRCPCYRCSLPGLADLQIIVTRGPKQVTIASTGVYSEAWSGFNLENAVGREKDVQAIELGSAKKKSGRRSAVHLIGDKHFFI